MHTSYIRQELALPASQDSATSNKSVDTNLKLKLCYRTGTRYQVHLWLLLVDR